VRITGSSGTLDSPQSHDLRDSMAAAAKNTTQLRQQPFTLADAACIYRQDIKGFSA
jgi:hypothetical protein